MFAGLVLILECELWFWCYVGVLGTNLAWGLKHFAKITTLFSIHCRSFNEYIYNWIISSYLLFTSNQDVYCFSLIECTYLCLDLVFKHYSISIYCMGVGLCQQVFLPKLIFLKLVSLKKYIFLLNFHIWSLHVFSCYKTRDTHTMSFNWHQL